MKNSALVKIDISAILDALDGDIIPSLYRDANYMGDVYIRPSNKSIAKISIAPPTIYKKKIYPSKDTYTDKNNAIINFGNSSSLLVNDTRYKSYLGFSLRDIPSNAVIESAKLNIYKESYTNNNSVDIYNVSNDYYEIGLTHLNAKPKDSKITNIQLENKSGYVVHDMLSYTTEWYNNSKDVDKSMYIESSNSETIIFSSKEAINKPYIEVEYYIQNQNIGISEVYGDIHPICVRNVPYSGEIYVESNFRESCAYGEIKIINQSRQIECSGDILATYSGNCQYDGEINIIQEKGEIEFISDILPSVEKDISYYGNINILTQNGTHEYNGEIVRQSSKAISYYGDINVVQQHNDISHDGEITVQYNKSSDIYGDIKIETQKSQYEYNGEIAVQYAKSASYNGDINIKTQQSQYEYTSDILVQYNKSSDIYGELEIAPEERAIEYNSEILVQYSKSSNIYGEVDIAVNKDQLDYNGEILVQYDKSSDIYGEIYILQQSNDLELDGDIETKLMNASLEYNGEIDPAVPRYAVVSGEINIDNRSSGYVITEGEICIKSGGYGYAFIM